MIEAAMIWNEPNNKSHWDFESDPGWKIFATMAKLAGQAIAAEAPGLPRVLGGMSPVDPDFLRVLEVQGVMDHIDAVAVHGFPMDWNHWMLEDWPDKIASIRACTPLPVWVSEVGISTFGAEEVQDWGLKRTAELLIGRAPRIHWYSLYDLPAAWPATTRHREAEGSSYYRHFHMGLYDEHGKPKLAARHFADFTPEIGLCQWFHYEDHRARRCCPPDARHGCDLSAHRTELGRLAAPERGSLVRPADARAGRLRRDGDVLLHAGGGGHLGTPHGAAAPSRTVCRVLRRDDPPLRPRQPRAVAQRGQGGGSLTAGPLTGCILGCLARRQCVQVGLAVVVAHPDDETIGAGASLHLFGDCVLIHVTDGAPRTLTDAHAAGFADTAGYAAQRRLELAAALQASGATPRLVALGVPDQGASACMNALVARLAEIFVQNRIRAVLTHAYEGGHPDHDATAYAVHRAARLCPQPLPVLEFAGYHADPAGGMVTGAFLANGPDATTIGLTDAECLAKRRMLDCFTTQRATLAAFGVVHEAFRPAPAYNFAEPPHAGALHYEKYDWGMTGPAWRALAAA